MHELANLLAVVEVEAVLCARVVDLWMTVVNWPAGGGEGGGGGFLLGQQKQNDDYAVALLGACFSFKPLWQTHLHPPTWRNNLIAAALYCPPLLAFLGR